jgi:GNAT superfamily N-acetyltransferase
MANITYERLTAADVLAIAALRGVDESGGASADRMARYLEGTHHPQFARRQRAMWGARTSQGALAGYVAGHLTSRFGCQGELQWIYVTPAHRRLGVATGLLGVIARWFDGQQVCRVCVDVGNDAARAFYARRGAVPLRSHWMVWPDIRTHAEPEESPRPRA